MRKLFEKCVVLYLALSLVISPEIFKAEENAFESMYENVYNEYKEDSEFQRMLDAYGEEYAQQYIEDVVETMLYESKVRGGGGNICYEYVKNIKQTKTYNCGSTTTLQTLYGLNSASNVKGSTDAAKIATLDAEYNVDAQGSMYVYQIVNALNKYTNLNSTYRYKVGTSFVSEYDLLCTIANSLTYCRPTILHARTKYISYYEGKATGHYLSVDYANRTTRQVRIVDCNYNSAYYGIHNNIPISEVYKSIAAESGRYLIY